MALFTKLGRKTELGQSLFLSMHAALVQVYARWMPHAAQNALQHHIPHLYSTWTTWLFQPHPVHTSIS